MPLHPVFDSGPGQHLLLLRQVVRVVALTEVLEPPAGATEIHPEVLLRGVYAADVDVHCIRDFFRFF